MHLESICLSSYFLPIVPYSGLSGFLRLYFNAFGLDTSTNFTKHFQEKGRQDESGLSWT